MIDTPELVVTDGDRQAPVPGVQNLAVVSPWPLTGQDNLRLTAVGAVASLTLTASIRTLNQVGRVQRQVLTMAVGSTRVVQTADFPIGDGYLLDVTVRATAGTPTIGQCYVLVDLVIGASGERQKLTTLCEGYVTANTPVYAPGAVDTDSLEGAGALRTITGTTPGAGVEITETVPTGARWLLQSFKYQLVTSATAGNRQSALIVDDGANILFFSGGDNVQVAGATFVYSYAAGYSPFGAPATNALGRSWPSGIFIAAAYRIRTQTLGILAGDQYSVIQYSVKEWLEI
jgi:hypothetical protein